MMKPFWIINLVLFQASWFSAAFLTQHAWLIMSAIVVLHFILSPTRKRDFAILALVPIGIVADKLQLHLGVFTVGNGFFPAWLVLLWVMFTVSLNHSLNWLSRFSLPALGLIGAIGGSSSYWAGIQAGVIEPLMSPSTVLLSLVIVWATLLPTFVLLKKRLERPVRVQTAG
jgi:hypothetical protein